MYIVHVYTKTRKELYRYILYLNYNYVEFKYCKYFDQRNIIYYIVIIVIMFISKTVQKYLHVYSFRLGRSDIDYY